MNKYLIEYHFWYGKEQKDHEQIELEADTDEEAEQLVRDLKKWVFKVVILEKNGIKINH